MNQAHKMEPPPLQVEKRVFQQKTDLAYHAAISIYGTTPEEVAGGFGFRHPVAKTS